MALAARNAPAVGRVSLQVLYRDARPVEWRKQGGAVLGSGFQNIPLVKFENVGSDEVADEYRKQDDDYIDDMQVSV